MLEISYHIFDHKFGKSLIAWDKDGVFVHYFDDKAPLKRLKNSYQGIFKNIKSEELPSHQLKLKKKLISYFSGAKVQFNKSDISLKNFSPFKKQVYEKLIETKTGQTVSYKELASLAGSSSASRAVGSCMSKNPMPIIIPCHRVLPASKKLGAFSSPSGASMKEKLLIFEGGVFLK